MGSQRIRLVEVGDIPMLAALGASGDGEGGASLERMVAYFEGRHHPQEALESRAGFVAERERRIVGYVAGHRSRRFGLDGELQWLFVDAAQRRTGVGARLVQALAEWFGAQGAHRVCVNVAPANRAAREFYVRLGARVRDSHWLVWDDFPADTMRG